MWALDHCGFFIYGVPTVLRALSPQISISNVQWLTFSFYKVLLCGRDFLAFYSFVELVLVD